ncbi:hypothetical protein HAX54_032730, partial [Datura stramonium]|nr:hypothetical protein [Datura stramonium]
SLPSTTYLLPLLLLELLDIDLRDTRPGARGRDAAIDGSVLPLDLRIMEDIPSFMLLVSWKVKGPGTEICFSYFRFSFSFSLVVAVGGKVALLPIPFGTTDFLVHHIHEFTIHETVLILLKGVLFARNSHLIPDKANLGFCFPSDRPRRGGTCQFDVWGSVSDKGVVTHITGGTLRRVLLLLMGGSMISYGHKHPSGRGYWQELIESIIWAHNKLKVAPTFEAGRDNGIYFAPRNCMVPN